IEICMNDDWKQAVKNAAELTRKIMKDEGIPLSRVVQHNHWSGKNCPQWLRSGQNGVTWAQFLNMIQSGATSTLKLGDRPLSEGDKGEDVRQLQAALNAANVRYKFTTAKPLTRDGSYGPLTSAFVLAFQVFVHSLPGL